MSETLSVVGFLAAWACVVVTAVAAGIYRVIEYILPDDLGAAFLGFWHSEDIHKVVDDPCCDDWECVGHG